MASALCVHHIFRQSSLLSSFSWCAKFPHSHASALALSARSLFISLTDYLSHSAILLVCQLAFVSHARLLVEQFVSFCHRPPHLALAKSSMRERELSFISGKIALRHNENLRKAFSFAESFIPYGSFVHFIRVSRLQSIHLEELKPNAFFSCPLSRRSGVRGKKKTNALGKLFMCEVIGLLQLVWLCPEKKNRLSHADVSYQLSATFTVFGQSKQNSLFLLFCRSSDSRSQRRTEKKENKNQFEVWLVVTEIHLSIEFWWIVCAYVITIYGAINRRVLSKLWPINLRSVDCGFCRGKAEFSTPKKLKRNTVLHRYVSSFSFAKHFQLHLYTFRRFVRFLIIPLAALSLSLSAIESLPQ